jgi:hypothetical protein
MLDNHDDRDIPREDIEPLYALHAANVACLDERYGIEPSNMRVFWALLTNWQTARVKLQWMGL